MQWLFFEHDGVDSLSVRWTWLPWFMSDQRLFTQAVARIVQQLADEGISSAAEVSDERLAALSDDLIKSVLLKFWPSDDPQYQATVAWLGQFRSIPGAQAQH